VVTLVFVIAGAELMVTEALAECVQEASTADVPANVST